MRIVHDTTMNITRPLSTDNRAAGSSILVEIMDELVVGGGCIKTLTTDSGNWVRTEMFWGLCVVHTWVTRSRRSLTTGEDTTYYMSGDFMDPLRILSFIIRYFVFQ